MSRSTRLTFAAWSPVAPREFRWDPELDVDPVAPPCGLPIPRGRISRGARCCARPLARVVRLGAVRLGAAHLVWEIHSFRRSMAVEAEALAVEAAPVVAARPVAATAAAPVEARGAAPAVKAGRRAALQAAARALRAAVVAA